MSSKNYKTWSKKSNKAKDLITEFDLFHSTSGTQGIDPNSTGDIVTKLYDDTPSLHKYNPRYFTTNFKNLVSFYKLNQSLNSGRSKLFNFILFYFYLSVVVSSSFYQRRTSSKKRG